MKMIDKVFLTTVLILLVAVTGLSQNENDRTCDGGELLRADQIIPIEDRMTPLDDPNTDDIVKAKREWDAWGKKECYDQERWKDDAQASCWKKLAENGDKRLWGAFLKGAYLKDMNLEEVYLASANLIEANLSGAKLMKADLTGANLTGADLTNADLSGAILNRATVSRSTTKAVDFADWKSRGGIVVD